MYRKFLVQLKQKYFSTVFWSTKASRTLMLLRILEMELLELLVWWTWRAT